MDGGRPLGRVDMAWDDSDGVIASWLEGGEERAEIRLRRFSADGPKGEPLVVARTSPSRASGFPRMVRIDQELYLAWVDIEGEEASRIRVLRIPLTALA